MKDLLKQMMENPVQSPMEERSSCTFDDFLNFTCDDETPTTNDPLDDFFKEKRVDFDYVFMKHLIFPLFVRLNTTIPSSRQ